MRHRLFARPADALPPLVLLLALLVGGYFWWQVDIVNEEAEHRARQDAALRAAQLADAMAGQVSSLFGTMDLGLLHVRDAWMRDPALVPRTAKAVLATFPEGVITHLSIAESEGYTVYSTVEGSPRTYVGDRVHFRSQQTGVDRMFIGRPVQSRLIPGWSFIVNRPVLRDGRFAGTVNLSIRADAMAALLGRVRLNSQDLVALVQADGTFQARSLDNLEAMGKAVAADRPFLAADAPDRGHFHRPGTLDSVARIYAWQRLPDAKLIVLVGLDEAALLAPLRREREADRRTAALMSGLLGLAGLLLAAVLARMQSQGRQLREDNLRRQQAEAELASSHAQLELRVAQRTAELTQQLQRNASVLSTAIDGFFAADLSGCIRQANPAFCAMLDYEEAELLGMRIPDVEAAETPEETAIHIEKVLAQGHNRFDTRHRRKDGGTLEVEVSVSLVRPGGEPMLYAFVRDIGPRKAAEEMLRQACDEAERANAAKSDFLSRMSHELRTPLNAVLGFAQVLQMPGGPPLSTLQAGHVLQIRNAGEHLLQLVNEVLDLARIESGRLDINAVPVALQPAIERCVAQIEGLAQARRIEVKLPPGDSCTVLADPLRLQQVLLNLLSNAVKYNREGGSIELACAPVAGQRVRVSVRDDGRGLNAEQQARLFRPFERLQAHRGHRHRPGAGEASGAQHAGRYRRGKRARRGQHLLVRTAAVPPAIALAPARRRASGRRRRKPPEREAHGAVRRGRPGQPAPGAEIPEQARRHRVACGKQRR